MEVNFFKQFENIGFLLLAIWLIITGALQVVGNPDLRSGPLLAALGISAGVCLLIGRYELVFDTKQVYRDSAESRHD